MPGNPYLFLSGRAMVCALAQLSSKVSYTIPCLDLGTLQIPANLCTGVKIYCTNLKGSVVSPVNRAAEIFL